MPISVTKLHPLFCAEIGGVGLQAVLAQDAEDQVLHLPGVAVGGGAHAVARALGQQ